MTYWGFFDILKNSNYSNLINNKTLVNRYSNIEIFTTDFKGKYLFRNDSNTIYGGSMIKDIVTLLQQNTSPENIPKILSEKYKTNIDNDLILDIINIKIQDFICKKKVLKKTFKTLIKINLNPSRKYPVFLLNLFKIKTFYVVFIITFSINILYYFINTNEVINLVTFNEFKYYEYLLICLLLFTIAIFHELGHIISAKHHDVNVKETGLGLYFIIPVLYVELTEAYKLNRRKKIVINLAGIYVQSIIGVILSVLCINFDSKIFFILFNSNLIVMVFNLNPFLKFDGYWAFQDLIKINNLMEKSTSFIKHIFKKTNTPVIVKIFSILKLCFIIYFLLFTLKTIINYAS